jgi:hypothetical protein
VNERSPISKKRWTARFPLPTDDDDTVRGVKRLSYENFLAPALGAMQFSPYGGLITAGYVIPRAAEIRARVERFTRFTLSEHVPETAFQMFEVAKGAMVYGLFFYPLYTIGEDHLSRLFEWVVKERYRTLSGRINDRNLKDALEWLLKSGHFPADSDVRWRAAYEIRNMMAHPTMQYITTPAEASRALRYMRDLLEHLYPEASP